MASGHSTRRSPRFIDLTGQKFGRWTVLAFHSIAYDHSRWLCRCECGIVQPVRGTLLKGGGSKGCRRCGATRHGHGKSGERSPEYQSWGSMLTRCQNARAPDYDRYGGRGIAVCERWLTFDNFLADMGPRPSPKHTLDRINNNGNYEPSNCRWATSKEQARNRRDNRILTLNSTTMCCADWANEIGMSKTILCYRLKHGWSIERSLTTPVRAYTHHKRSANKIVL